MTSAAAETGMQMTNNGRHRGRRVSTRKHALGRVGQLTELLHRLDSARDEERKQLSSELHDTLVAALSATKLECDWLLRSQATSGMENQRRLSRLSGSLAEAIQFTRRVIDQLWPTAVQHLGLVPAIQGQLSELRTRLGVDVRPEMDGDLETLPEQHAMILYRTVQEVLRPLVQSALPPRVAFTLRRGAKGVELQLNLAGAATNGDGEWGPARLELALMRERVLQLKGEYLLTADGHGMVHLRLFLPSASRSGRSRAAFQAPEH
jgi:signal transduction histidine kinase